MGNFSHLSPLKKWVITNKYFIKTTDSKEKKLTATHFLLDGGIWSIPKEIYSEFLRLLAVDLQNGEKHYICENRTEVFKFICDIDMFDDIIISIDSIKIITLKLQEIINIYFGDFKVIICGSDSKTIKKIVNETEIELIKSGFHLVWPDIWITVETAKKIRILFIERLIEHFGERESYNKWEDVVDLAVYEDNGLRMVGCRKISPCKSCKNKKEFRETCETCKFIGKIDENRIYSPKAVLGNCCKNYLESIGSYYVMLPETSIYNYNNLPETVLIKELEVTLTKKTKVKVTKKSEDEIIIKLENFIKRNYKNKFKINKLTKNENCYYAQPDDNFCMNVNRKHTTSEIYFQITPNGICQKCYCKKETSDGRINGPCKDYSSEVIPLNKILQILLFGSSTNSRNKKKIVNTILTRNQSNNSLDLSVSSSDNYNINISNEKSTCLANCKNILYQIENELKLSN